MLSAFAAPNALQLLPKLYPRFRYHKFRNVKMTYWRLLRDGHIKQEWKNNQVYISLTPKGKAIAGRLQIDALSIKKPRKWDGRWRFVIFDIQERDRKKREALRGLMMRLGLRLFQKSVWICPYDCRDEIAVLQEFFDFVSSEIQYIEAVRITDSKKWEKAFNVSH